jgi:hypothetical protein
VSVCVCLAGWLAVCMNLCIGVSMYRCIYLCMYEDAPFTLLKIFALWERHVPRLTQFEFLSLDTVELL